jgi:hypothetical protein
MYDNVMARAKTIKYKACIQNSQRHIVPSKVKQTVHDGCSIKFKSFEAMLELDYIPIIAYIDENLNDNQSITIMLCHLNYIIEKLVNRYPVFNTQAIMSLGVVTMKAIIQNNTIEEVVNEEVQL